MTLHPYVIQDITVLQGIPIIYYGTEQAFNGADDPNNRESLWPHYNTNFDLYRYISTLTGFRKKVGSSAYLAKQVERYVDDQFFAFTRDKVRASIYPNVVANFVVFVCCYLQLFVATTNVGSGQSLTRTITYHPYSDGTGTCADS